MWKTILLSLSLVLLTLTLPSCDQMPGASAQGSPVDGESGHAHAADGAEPVSLTLFTPKVLLFMEYPQLVKGEPAEFLAHFSVLATGEPVQSGTMTLEATAPNGTVETVRLNAPARAGIFIPEHAFKVAGTYQGRLILESPQVRETIEVGEMIVHKDRHDAEHAAAASAGEDPPDTVSFLLEQQWKVGTLLGQVERRSLTKRLRLPGKVATAPNAAALVTAPVGGRLLPPQSGQLPRIGETVEAGQVLGYIEPPLPATEAAALLANRAQLQAMETELVLRGLDLATKGLEVERDLKQAETRLDFAKRAAARIEILREKGVSFDQQYDSAQQERQLAQAEFEAALSLKASYEESASRLADLQEQLKARGVVTNDSATTMRLPLVAPITGEIASRTLVAGQHIEALEEVCEILNVDRVWVVAQLSEFDLNQLPDTPNATFQLPAIPERTFDVAAMNGSLVGLGARVDERTRTVPIRFDLPNPDRKFRVGMIVDVLAETDSAVDCLTVPEEAIVMDNGRHLVYVMLEGETFQRREVELGIRDNGHIQILSGVSEGERVATEAAYAIKLASLSPASFGHGHGH